MQTPRWLVCLCTDCHTATHIGLAGIKGKGLAAVTGMSAHEVKRHVSSAFSVWEARSAVNWTLDLSILTDAGVTVLTRPPSKNHPAGDFATRAGTCRERARASRLVRWLGLK